LGGSVWDPNACLFPQWPYLTRHLDGFDVYLEGFVVLGKPSQEPSLPLLISSPQRLTAWWCRFMCILFRVWLLHLRSMCGARSDPPHKGQVAGPVWLNLLVCLPVCIRPVLKDLFLLLESHIWHGPKLVTELGICKGLCSSLPCARVWTEWGWLGGRHKTDLEHIGSRMSEV